VAEQLGKNQLFFTALNGDKFYIRILISDETACLDLRQFHWATTKINQKKYMH
jgi:hypothetical protein